MQNSNLDFKEIDVHLRRHSKPVYDQVQEPLNDNVIESTFNSLELKSDSLFAMYSWKNGILFDNRRFIGEYDMCSYGKMIPLKDAAEFYQVNVYEEMWGKRFFPIFTTYGGDFLLYDVNERSETFGMILLYAPALLVTEPTTIFDDVSGLFAIIISCYKSGVYKFNLANKALEIDLDSEHAIAKKLNPKSQYWRT